jgi:protein-L-isoaspartate(D-aspartate) O-methyltransferase
MIDFAAAREAMVDCQVRPSDVTRYPIIEAMLTVPREEFLPEAMRPVAYLGEHIPLAPGRVLLDPRVFAKMLDALNVTATDFVLDIGCGYGYSSAVLAQMCEVVVALEENADLAAKAQALLSAHSADNAVVETGPLAAGVPAQGPYDAIIVEGGIEELPEAITDQLKVGGRVVAIFLEGRGGQARLGLKMSHGIAWRRVFDASAPKLFGFETAKTFVF